MDTHHATQTEQRTSQNANTYFGAEASALHTNTRESSKSKSPSPVLGSEEEGTMRKHVRSSQLRELEGRQDNQVWSVHPSLSDTYCLILLYQDLLSG